MKKISALILASVLGISVLSGCNAVQKTDSDNANTNAAADTSLEDIKEKGYFVVGLDATFAPMGFTDENGEIVGFDIDLAKAVAEKMDVEVQFQPIDWDSKSMELSSGNIDVIWNGFSISDERKKEVLFTDPYLTTGQVIVVKADSEIAAKKDLAGKKIALQDGSTSEKALKEDTETYEAIGEENISRFKENSQVLMEVEAGRADAAVIDEIFVRYYLAQENMLDKFKVLDERFAAEDYGVGGRMNDKSFIEAVNKAIAECKSEGIASEYSVKWFGEDMYK